MGTRENERGNQAMVRQIELWKARRRGKKRARNDFERDMAHHMHLCIGTPTPRSDRTMEAYIKKGLGYLTYVAPENPESYRTWLLDRQ